MKYVFKSVNKLNWDDKRYQNKQEKPTAPAKLKNKLLTSNCFESTFNKIVFNGKKIRTAKKTGIPNPSIRPI